MLLSIFRGTVPPFKDSMLIFLGNARFCSPITLWTSRWISDCTKCSDVPSASRLSELYGFDVTSSYSDSLISKDFGLNELGDQCYFTVAVGIQGCERLTRNSDTSIR